MRPLLIVALLATLVSLVAGQAPQYVGTTFLRQGWSVEVAGYTGTTGASLKFELGHSSCTATTDATGTGVCSINTNNANLGANVLQVVSSSGSTSVAVTVFGFPRHGTFVVGDLSFLQGGVLTFYGKNWRSQNSFSASNRCDPSFYGWQDDIFHLNADNICGLTWLHGGASEDKDIPSVMGVLVVSQVGVQFWHQTFGNIVGVAVLSNVTYNYAKHGQGTGTGVATGFTQFYRLPDRPRGRGDGWGDDDWNDHDDNRWGSRCHSCQTCPTNFYQFAACTSQQDTVCKACPSALTSACTSCGLSSSGSVVCLSCAPGSGTFLSNGQCVPCDVSCSSCINSATNCLTCNGATTPPYTPVTSPLPATGGQCAQVVANPCIAGVSTQGNCTNGDANGCCACAMCNAPASVVVACTPTQQTWCSDLCDAPCLTCVNGEPTNCLSCADRSTETGSSIYRYYDYFVLPNGPGSCHECTVCVGGTLTHCSLDTNGDLIDTVCCDPSCAHCSGTAANQCTSCPGNAALAADGTCPTKSAAALAEAGVGSISKDTAMNKVVPGVAVPVCLVILYGAWSVCFKKRNQPKDVKRSSANGASPRGDGTTHGAREEGVNKTVNVSVQA